MGTGGCSPLRSCLSILAHWVATGSCPWISSPNPCPRWISPKMFVPPLDFLPKSLFSFTLTPMLACAIAYFRVHESTCALPLIVNYSMK